MRLQILRQRFFDNDGGAGAGAGAGDGAGSEWKPPTKEEFEARIREEFGKGKRLGADAAALAKQERDRLSELERFHAERTAADKEREEKLALEKGDFEKAREKVIASAAEAERKKWEPEVQKREERIKRLESKFQGAKRDKLLAASGARAYSPVQVADLLDRRIRLNEDFEPEVIDENGEPALVAGKPMTIQQLVDSYLDANPNLVKVNGGGSGGAGGGKSLKDGPEGEVEKLEAAVKAAAEKYQKHRRSEDLTEHRRLTVALNEAKAKAGK